MGDIVFPVLLVPLFLKAHLTLEPIISKLITCELSTNKVTKTLLNIQLFLGSDGELGAINSDPSNTPI